MDVTQTNLVEIITQTINTLFQNLFSSIDNNVYSILDDIAFIGPNFLKDSFLENLLGTSSSTGILLISNSLLIGFLLFYCIQLFFCSYTFTPIQKPYQFLCRILLVAIFLNSSFFVCEQTIQINFLLSSSIRNIGEILFQKNICFSELITHLNSIITINDSSLNLFSMDGIIKSIASIGLFNLVFVYSLRYIMIKVFILICPFAILCLTLHSTQWIFKTWLRCFFSLLILQIFISIILLIIFSLDFHSNLFSKLMYIGSIYALIKANSYIRELFGGISTDITSNIGINQKIIK